MISVPVVTIVIVVGRRMISWLDPRTCYLMLDITNFHGDVEAEFFWFILEKDGWISIAFSLGKGWLEAVVEA